MLAVKRDSEGNSSNRRRQFSVGDRVITNNCRLGTVVRIDEDDMGEYVVLKLDILPGEFAYDPWDIEKV